MRVCVRLGRGLSLDPLGRGTYAGCAVARGRRGARARSSVGLVMSVFIVAQVKCPRAFAPLRALIAGHPGLIAIS